MLILAAPKGTTKESAAKKLGLKTYDTALPQPWLDDVVNTLFTPGSPTMENYPTRTRLYDAVLSGTVWSYDGNLFGRPYALTEEALNLINAFNEIKGYEKIEQPSVITLA